MSSNDLKNPDGSWKYTNSLADSVSPYLLQHAHNPVNWHSWSKDTLDLAKKQNKPILLSIGYSTCYWCHVMEREVFARADIAKIMNENFINIKVDREERPDIDDVYMVARQIITKEGGWPNNVFLTPELKPFFAGGNFAPDRRYESISFIELLEGISSSWQDEREKIDETAEIISEGVKHNLSSQCGESFGFEVINYEDLVALLFDQMREYTDYSHGGFFEEPKFSHENYLTFLLDYYEKTKDNMALDIIDTTLLNMASGGIFDHLGGGFHRYSVDRQWVVPHFEKMLYNQAALSKIYARAYNITGNEFFKEVCQRTLSFVTKTMKSSKGGFYSALDAETGQVEGKYYAFTKEAVEKCLTKSEQKLFFASFAIESIPTIEGHKSAKGGVIFIKNKKILEDDKLRHKVYPLLEKLKKARQSRRRPSLDDKIIVSWNSLMIDSLACCSDLLDEPSYMKLAEKCAKFIWNNMSSKDLSMKRVYRDGKASGDGHLEDYAFYISGLLSLYKVSKNKLWLDRAKLLSEKVDELFWDVKGGGYFATLADEQSIVRVKAGSDAALVSDNSVMLNNLIDIDNYAKVTSQKFKINTLVKLFYEDIIKSPMSYANIVCALIKLAKDIEPLPDVEDELYGDVELGELANDNVEYMSSDNYLKIHPITNKGKINENGEITISIDIEIQEGWYMSSTQSKEGSLSPISIIVGNVKGFSLRTIKYPKASGIINHNNEEISIYKDKISIKVTLTKDSSQENVNMCNFSAVLTAQVCKEGVCLLPSDLALSEKISIK